MMFNTIYQTKIKERYETLLSRMWPMEILVEKETRAKLERCPVYGSGAATNGSIHPTKMVRDSLRWIPHPFSFKRPTKHTFSDGLPLTRVTSELQDPSQPAQRQQTPTKHKQKTPKPHRNTKAKIENAAGSF
jgi:hypothetical protein